MAVSNVKATFPTTIENIWEIVAKHKFGLQKM